MLPRPRNRKGIAHVRQRIGRSQERSHGIGQHFRVDVFTNPDKAAALACERTLRGLEIKMSTSADGFLKSPNDRGGLVRSRPRRNFSALFEKEWVLGYALILPAVVIILGFKAQPFLLGIWMALTDKVVGEPASFIGLANFTRQLGSPIFREAVQNTFLYTAAAVTCKSVLGMWLALLLHRKFFLSRAVRASVLLPFIVPTALGALAWLWMLDASYSVFNWALNWFWNMEISLFGLILKPDFPGMVYIPWLGDGFWAKVSIITVNVWRGLPFFAIMFLAGLQTVPQDLYDAGDIDGVNRWQRFWHITLPSIKPIVVVVLVFSIVLTFADFELVYILTRGGPYNSTHLLGTYAFQLSMGSGNLGEGAAVALYMLPVLAALIVWQLIYLRRDDKNE